MREKKSAKIYLDTLLSRTVYIFNANFRVISMRAVYKLHMIYLLIAKINSILIVSMFRSYRYKIIFFKICYDPEITHILLLISLHTEVLS